MNRYFLLGVLTLFVGYSSTSGRSYTQYNERGGHLPADHAYMCVVDHLGYLWIATTKGLVKYNGYNFETFDQSDGLPANDIWGLFPDDRGRIWLYCYSSSFGYMYNDKFNKIYFKTPIPKIYPRYISQAESSIVFLTGVLQVVNSDTATSLYDSHVPRFISNKGTLFSVYDQFITKSEIEKNQIGRPDTLRYSKTGKINFANTNVLNDNLIYRDDSQLCYVSVNFVTGREHLLASESSNLFIQDSFFYLPIHGSVIKFNNKLEAIATTDINTIYQKERLNDAHINYLLKDKFWGEILCTKNAGIFVNHKMSSQFKLYENTDLTGYVLLGKSINKLSFWWNKNIRQLKLIDSGGKIKSTQMNFPTPRRLVPYNIDTSILISNYIYWVDNKYANILGKVSTSVEVYNDNIVQNGLGTYDVFAANPDSIFLAGSFSLMMRVKRKGLVNSSYLDEYKYTNIVYDSTDDFLLAYEEDRALLLINNSKTIIVNQQLLSSVGIEHIHKIHTTPRKIFIKTNEKIFVFDKHTLQLNEILTNFNVKDAHLLLHNRIVVVIGRMGIVFASFDTRNTPDKYAYYPNVNDYDVVLECDIINNGVLFTTENAAYTVPLPKPEEYKSVIDDKKQYKVIMTANSLPRVIQHGDTITLKKTDENVALDVIKPLGNGSFKLFYRIGDHLDWQEIEVGQLNLSGLKPGSYHEVSIYAQDKSWRSQAMRIYLYVVPSWWQTETGKLALFLTGFVCLTLLMTSAIAVTRRITMTKNKERERLVELELKSVYAQLNPHFIFNALTAALNFIQKQQNEKAYAHIEKFSRLLRSYLRSSRNRFIPLSEEVTNLRNYIELQQTRFEHRFIYDVAIDESIDIDTQKVPTLLYQPFVENAIHHGLLPSVYPGMLSVKFSIENEYLVCIIDDNGIGRVNSRKINDDNYRESYGQALFDDLVKVYKMYEKIRIEIDYYDKEAPFTGTVLTIKVSN